MNAELCKESLGSIQGGKHSLLAERPLAYQGPSSMELVTLYELFGDDAFLELRWPEYEVCN
jgi:hypothetical protein